MNVGGYECPTSGEIAGREIPDDHAYYLTSFGGGADTQPVACGGPIADGTWYYLADSWRFGCGARVRIANPANGNWVVAQVADVGPNVCVEQAAGRPVIDASPLVSQHLFGTSSRGYADHSLVTADVVDPSTPLGPGTGAPFTVSSGVDWSWLLPAALALATAVAAYLAWRAGDLAAVGLPGPRRGRRAYANPSHRRRRRGRRSWR